MAFLAEKLDDNHVWWRIADPAWRDPLDASFAAHFGGRWNPAGGFAALYLNEEKVTARLNLRAFISQWPYEPEDLRNDTGPVLVGAKLPRAQQVCDVHSRYGVVRAGLHENYPHDLNGVPVSHAVCQSLGQKIKQAGLRGVRCRSAQSRDGAGRELAWFPANARSRATRVKTIAYEDWYWA